MKTDEIYQQTLAHFLAPITPLLDDESVTEVMVNGAEDIYYERQGQVFRSESRFSDDDCLLAAIQNIAEYVNRRIDPDHHSLDARLPSGSRVHAIIPPSARRGPFLTIRKFQKSNLSLDSLIDNNAMSALAAEFLSIAVKLKKNIVVSGGTGTGKNDDA